MCNRVAAPEFREIKVRWNLFNDLAAPMTRFNVGPDGRELVTVVHNARGNEGHIMSWPLVPAFSKTERPEYSTSNATAERLLQSPVYKRLINKRRCLIPVNGFYEWQGKKPPKTPLYIYLKSGEPFALAGLWDIWNKPDGSTLESFTIITTAPNDFMKPIHNRMPLILKRGDEERWLDCAANDFAAVNEIVKPFDSDLMAAHEVSRRINNPKYEAPDCNAPVER